jgi:mycothiol synthase
VSELATVVNPTAGLIPALLALVRDVERTDGHEVLESHRWIDLANADAESPHGAGVLVGEEMVGYVHLRRHRRHGVELELLVAPAHRSDARTIVEALVSAAGASAELGPEDEVFTWVPAHSTQVIDALLALGFVPDRSVRQLRRPLPLPPEDRARPPQPCWPLRSFRPGLDEQAWLVVNNRAFAWHPDQGDWDLETLRAREQEPWFDPAGFLMAELDGELVGFCWTKVHNHRGSDAIGEIYVIATDPERAPRGLGSCLLAAGLDHLASRGLATAMLYVETTNERALRLYDRFGFVLDHEDVRLVRAPRTPRRAVDS